MGKSSPSPPPPPDYAAAAKAQGQANVDAARLAGKIDNPNIISPYGGQTVTFGQPAGFNQAGYDAAMKQYNDAVAAGANIANPANTPNYSTGANPWLPKGVIAPPNFGGVGGVSGPGGGSSKPVMPNRQDYVIPGDPDQATVRQYVTPTAQQTIDTQQQVQLQLANLAGQGTAAAQQVIGSPFTPNLPKLQTGLDTSGVAQIPVNAGRTGQDAIMARLQPQIDQRQKAFQQNMANQGLVPGGEAYDNAARDESRAQNDLLSQAALQGLNLDFSANNQGYNQALQSGQFGNQALQQSLQQQLALRQQPLNEITGLMSGSQIQLPQFQGYQGQNVQPAPLFNAATAQYQDALQNYGIQSAQYNSGVNGLYGLLGSGAQALGYRYGR